MERVLHSRHALPAPSARKHADYQKDLLAPSPRRSEERRSVDGDALPWTFVSSKDGKEGESLGAALAQSSQRSFTLGGEKSPLRVSAEEVSGEWLEERAGRRGTSAEQPLCAWSMQVTAILRTAA